MVAVTTMATLHGVGAAYARAVCLAFGCIPVALGASPDCARCGQPIAYCPDCGMPSHRDCPSVTTDP